MRTRESLNRHCLDFSKQCGRMEVHVLVYVSKFVEKITERLNSVLVYSEIIFLIQGTKHERLCISCTIFIFA